MTRIDVSRAVILARGLGRRMQSADQAATLTDEQRRAADAGLKAMMPIAGRPFLDYLLSALADAGLRHVAIVVAPDHDVLRHHYQVASPPERVTVDFVVQQQPVGTADAVLATEPWTRAEPFLVMNGDNLYPAAVLAQLAALAGPGLPGFDRAALVRTGNIPEARLRAFALIEHDDRGYLTRIVEKPDPAEVERAGPHARVSMNCWRFDAGIFPACRDVPRSRRGELELPEAVGLAVQRGGRFQVVPVAGGVLDLSERGDAAEVTRRLQGMNPHP